MRQKTDRVKPLTSNAICGEVFFEICTIFHIDIFADENDQNDLTIIKNPTKFHTGSLFGTAKQVGSQVLSKAGPKTSKQ